MPSSKCRLASFSSISPWRSPSQSTNRVEGLGIGFLDLEHLGQSARACFLVEPSSRRELGAQIEDPGHDHRYYPIAFFGRFRGDERIA